LKRTNVLDRIKEGRVLFDGAMGTMLIAQGLSLGKPPEQWNLDRPSLVREVHVAYLSAGAEVIETNTFGAGPSRLSSHGLGSEMERINTAGILLARDAVSGFEDALSPEAPGNADETPPEKNTRVRFVAFSIGPTGKMLPPVGKAAPEEIADDIAAQILETRADYDMILIETMFDLREALVAVAAAKKHAAVPVAATLTFMKNPRGFFTIMGDEPVPAMRKLEHAGADVLGANCTIASPEMLDLARTLREATDSPLLCQPNAGQPRVKAGLPVYDQTPREFAKDAISLFSEGINAVGGCCGTTPRVVHEVRARMSEQ
jgi:5-methyltetrahydrofolate--homocysteine methyltransferase